MLNTLGQPWSVISKLLLEKSREPSHVLLTHNHNEPLGTGQNAGPFFRRERSVSVSSEEVRLIGFRSGKLISVVTPLSLPSFSAGAPIFLWAILSNRRVLLFVLLGCTVRSTGNG